ncbi:MAG: DUF5695 domain-containing protein [Planctomycetota bacterium]|nr:DUF5695 domain-containing protein [Planctomycetota bacterium]
MTPSLVSIALVLSLLPPSDVFDVKFDAARGGITRLANPKSPGLNFILDGASLGEVEIRARAAGGPWRDKRTAASADVRQVKVEADGRTWNVTYSMPSKAAGGVRDVVLAEAFSLKDDSLDWTLRLQNATEGPLEIGDLALPLRMNNAYTKDAEETFERRVFRHAFISGHGSFLFWLPVDGSGPHLVMTPHEDTKLELFTDRDADYALGGGAYRVFVHSAATGGELAGTWRQKHTSAILQPRGTPGDQMTCGFRFRWAGDYRGVREALYQGGGFDVHVAPGMVVPEDLFALVALRTRNRIESVAAEHPDQTSLEYLGEKQKDTHVYRVKFSRLGENLLTVRCAGGRSMVLEFFVTEPLETLVRKRAAFIAGRQQHRCAGKWYDGLFSLWDVRMPPGRNLLGPENLGGQAAYAVSGSDDPSNSKCIYLSQKNVAYPEPREIEALEYFLEHFVWGKHQRTDRELPHPYGIYGSDSWQQCRTSAVGLNSGGHGQERMWRTFDYTTYFALYYNMYRIARQNPQMVRYLDAKGYLERAYGTARAYFEVPYNIRMQGWAFNGWCDWAYKQGNFHEKYLLEIIAALEDEGQREKAAWLRDQWEKKVRYFLCDDPRPWVSEMPVDSTAYESTYAIARWALQDGVELKPVERLWRDKNSGRWYSYPEIDRKRREDFLGRQLLANLACRGWLETSYYHLGSDFRAGGSAGYTLSYMSQMGGWAILDHALRFADEPAELAQLGYASMLSSWALVNSGRPETNYGYWRPGAAHDGAAAWAFLPQKFGREWNPGCQVIARGPWPVDGEIDHGLAAGVEGASTVVVEDPIFGLLAYGGLLRQSGETIGVVPRDGVRQRFFLVRGRQRLHVALERDGFAREEPIMAGPSPGALRFVLENRAGRGHTTCLGLSGLPPGNYEVLVRGQPQGGFRSTAGREVRVEVPLDEGSGTPVEVRPARD